MIELLHRLLALAALVMQDREVERRREAVRRVRGHGALERLLGLGILPATVQHFAQTVPKLSALRRPRGATRRVLRFVVPPDRHVGPNEAPLRRDPFVVARRHPRERRGGLLVLARPQELRRVVDRLCRRRRGKEQQRTGKADPSSLRSSG